jgi:hypothetical protein
VISGAKNAQIFQLLVQNVIIPHKDIYLIINVFVHNNSILKKIIKKNAKNVTIHV